MKCPNCGQNLSDTARFCSRCGQPICQEPPKTNEEKEPEKKCPYCGYSIPASAQFCYNCGHMIDSEIPEQDMQTEPRQTTIQDSRERRPGHKILGVAVLAAVVVLALAAALLFMKNNADQPMKKTADSAPAVSQSEPEEAEQNTSEPEQEPEENTGASEQQKELPALEEKTEQPEQQDTAPAAQINEQWGQQEILISPTEPGKATLTLRQKYQGSWTTLFECEAAIGRNGTTASPAEGDGKTPEGTFPILFCYGLQQPQTGIPFIQLTSDSVWVDDAESMYYNCLTTRQQAGDASYEDTYSQFSRGYYSYNIFFANNGDGQTPGKATPGMGSVRVLEGYKKKLEPTNGDIKISEGDMQSILAILNAEYDPVVTVSGL